MDRLLFGIFLGWTAGILLLPGGESFPALALVSLSILFLTVVFLIAARWGRFSIYRVPGILPLGLFAVFLLCQVVPLPPFIIQFFAPEKFDTLINSIWILSPGSWIPLSPNPKWTLLEFFLSIAYLCYYWIAVQFLARADRIRQTAKIAVIAVIVHTGIILGLSMVRGGWLLEVSPGLFRLLSGFITPHVLTGLLVMTFPLVLALGMADRPSLGHSHIGSRLGQSIRYPASSPHLLYGMAGLLLIGFLWAEKSSEAALGLMAGLILFSALLLVRGLERIRELPVVAFAFILLVFPVMEGKSGYSFDRLEGKLPSQASEVQVNLTPAVFTMSTEDGTELDGFSPAGSDYPFYLDLFSRNGRAGSFFILWFLGAVAWQTFPVWRRRRNKLSRYLYPASVAGIIAAVVFWTTDGGLEQASLGALFFLLAGLMVSTANSQTLAPFRTELNQGRPLQIPVALFVFGLLLLINCVFLGSIFASSAITHSAENTGNERSANLAARMDPLESRNFEVLFRSRRERGDIEGATEALKRMLLLDSGNAATLEQAGLFLDHVGRATDAERLLRLSASHEKPGSPIRQRFLSWLISRDLAEEALREAQSDLVAAPDKSREYLNVLSDGGLSDESLEKILPELPISYLHYGEFLLEKGKTRMGEESFLIATVLNSERRMPDPSPFLRIFEYFFARKKYDVALAAVEAGIRTFPHNAEFRRSAGILYELQGITYRAIEEYRFALFLEPDHKGVRESLNRLTGKDRN